MSLGTWDPSSTNADLAVTNFNIEKYISLSYQFINKEISELNQEEINELCPLILQEPKIWQQICANISSENIIALMKFFILTEEKYSQLHSGKKSPVIALTQLLKQREFILSKDFLLWIKKNSTNRFLPNGSIF